MAAATRLGHVRALSPPSSASTATVTTLFAAVYGDGVVEATGGLTGTAGRGRPPPSSGARIAEYSPPPASSVSCVWLW